VRRRDPDDIQLLGLLARLAEFLGGAFTNGPEVARCIRPELYRRR